MRSEKKSRRVFFHHALFRKLISSFVALSFIVTSVALPPSSFADNSSSVIPRSEETRNLKARSLADARDDKNSTLILPQDLGTIDESFKGTSDKTILYIQDAHDSLEAQENIAKIIQSLVKDHGIKTVFEEGYEGPVPTDEYFGSIKEGDVKEKVSYFFLDQLRIGAAEYAHINRKDDFKLIGADSSKLHLENISWAQKNSRVRIETEKDIAELSKYINKLASQYFPKEIKDWMKLRERFDTQQLSLLDYLKRLMGLGTVLEKDRTVPGLSAVPEYPNISLLLESQTSKDPALLEKVKAIDSKTLFAELGKAEDDLAKRYLKDERDEQVFHYHNQLSLLSRLNHLEVTPDEYEISKNSLKDLNTSKLAEFIVKETRKSLVLSTRWEKNIQNAIGFYETAKARDTSIEGALKSFKSNSNEKTAILVFGGFHKAGVKEILRKEGFSYTIIAPRISKEDPRHKASYQELMSVGYHPYELPNTIARSSRPESIFQVALTLGKTPVLDYIRQLADYVQAKGAGLANAVLSRTLTKAVTPRFALALATVGGAALAPGALPAAEAPAPAPRVAPVAGARETVPQGASYLMDVNSPQGLLKLYLKDIRGNKLIGIQDVAKDEITYQSLNNFGFGSIVSVSPDGKFAIASSTVNAVHVIPLSGFEAKRVHIDNTPANEFYIFDPSAPFVNLPAAPGLSPLDSRLVAAEFLNNDKARLTATKGESYILTLSTVQLVLEVPTSSEIPLISGSSDYFHFGFDPAQFYVTVKDAAGNKVQKTLKEALLTGALERFRLRLRFKGPAVIFKLNGERAYVTKRYRSSYVITAGSILEDFPTELLLPKRLRKDIQGTRLDLDKGLELEVTRGKTVLGTVTIEPMAGSSAEAPAQPAAAVGKSLGKMREEVLRKPLMTLMLGAILGLSGFTPAFALGKVQEAPKAPQEVMKEKAPQDPIQKLVSQLISTDTKKIEAAKNELIKIGKPAISTLVQEIIGLRTEMYETMTGSGYMNKIYPSESEVNGFDAIVQILKEINDPALSSTLIEISNIKSFKVLVAIEGKDAARSLLIKATKNNDPRIRSWALDGLDGRVGAESSAVIPLAVEALQDNDPRVRHSAVYRLGASRDASVIPALAGALKDSDPKVRAHAVLRLRWFEIPDSLISTLIGMLQDDNTEVRIEVVFLLGGSKSPLALSAVMEAWKDREAEVRRAVVSILKDEALAPSLAPFLIEAAKDRRDKDPNFSSHRVAVDALVKLKEKSAVPALIEALDYRTGSDLLWIIDGLGEIRDPQAIPALTEILKNKDRQGRGPAAATLAKLAGKSAIPLLLDALKDENPNVRMGAVNGLNILRDPATIPALANMLKDKDYGVMNLAVSTLEAIGTPEADAILSEHANRSLITPSRQPEKADAGQKTNWWIISLGAGLALFLGVFIFVRLPIWILNFGEKGVMSAQPYLRMLLKWPELYIRSLAIFALGEYGSRATSKTVLALQEAAKDPRLNADAANAIRNIFYRKGVDEVSGQSLGKAREEALKKEGLPTRRGFLGTVAKLATAFAVGSFGGVGCDISTPEKEEGPPFVAAVAPSATGTVSSLPLNSAGQKVVPSVIQDSANSATRLTGDVSTIGAFGQVGVRLDYNVTGSRDLIFSGFGYVADDFRTPLPDTLDLSGIPILTIAVRGNGPTFSPNAMFEIQDTAGRKAIYSLEQISGSFGFYKLDLSLTRVFSVDLTQIATLSLIEDPKSAGANPVGSYTLLLGNTDTQYLPLATITGQPAGTLTDYPLNNEATPKQAEVQVAISGGNSASQVPDVSTIPALGVQGRLWNYNLPVFVPNTTPTGYAAMIYTLDNWGTGPIETGDFSGLTELTFAVRGASAPYHTQMFFEVVDQAGNKARFLLDGITDTFQHFTIPLANLPLDITKIKETTFFVDPSIVSAAVPSGSFVVVAKNISGASLGAAQKVFELTDAEDKDEVKNYITEKVMRDGVAITAIFSGRELTARVNSEKNVSTLESLKQYLESNNLAREVSGKSLGAAEVVSLSEEELNLLREPDEKNGFISKRVLDNERIRKQVIQIEKALGRTEDEVNANVEKALTAAKGKFKGEEVHILYGTGPKAKVIGRIDREIAEQFGYIHETANIILLTPGGEVILQLRNKKNYDDHLAMYGGHLEVGESHANGALEETKQETGIEHFENPQIFIDYESYDEAPNDNNRERRSWFVRQLTPEEWATMRKKKAGDEAIVGASHSDDDRKTYKGKLSQLWKDGKGEVTGVYTFTVDQIAKALQEQNPQSKLPDKSNHYLTVTDKFKAGEESINAFFTPDALDRLVRNLELWGKVKEHAQGKPADTVSPERPAQGASLGAAVNDVAQSFNVAERLDALKANTTLYVDFRNIKAKQMNEAQLTELFGFALRNPEKVKLVIHNAVAGDEALEFFKDVKNKEIIAGDINKAFAQFGTIGTNSQLSKEGVDPAKDFTADRTKMKFFRYQAEETGLVAVALLYSEFDKIQQKLAGLEEKNGYFYVVGQILQGLVQAYQAQLVVKRAA